MFLPKRSKIFNNLVEQSLLIEKAAQVFQEITHDWSRLRAGSETLKNLESQADSLVHLISSEVAQSFILPLDREDIDELTERLDDIIDGLEQTANRLVIYGIAESGSVMTENSDAIKKFSDIILQATSQVSQGIREIKDHRIHSEEFSLCCQKLHTLENQGDVQHRGVLTSMMEAAEKTSANCQTMPILALIKWKEIFQTIEDTLDVCEKIAIIFEKLKIKYT